MRILWPYILLGIVVVASAFLAGVVTTSHENNTPISITTARKLIKDASDVGLSDYGPVDPSPSAQRLQPAPIQHGTPMIPYVPKPSPPPRG